jgi:YD repeat-containing protein
MKAIVPLLFSITIFISCDKGNRYVSTESNSCSNFTILDSTMPNSSISGPFVANNYQQEYIFNDDGLLIKHVTLESIGEQKYVVTVSDSFAYSNGNMVKSYFSLDSNNSSNPYTTSEYDYTGHILTASRYYLGSSLIVHSTYVVDSTGKIMSITQYADNTTLQWTPSTTYNFNYDQFGNLYEVTDSSNNVYYKYLNYDNNPNPFYKLPFDYAYNVWEYCAQVFSTHNPGLSYIYNIVGAGQWDSLSNAYSYSYTTNGRVLTSIHTPSNGRVSNGPGTSDYSTFKYQCN